MPDIKSPRGRGFTLLEVLMVIVLIGIISITAGLLIFQGTKSFHMLDMQKDLTGQGTLAIERLSRELRFIRCTTAGNNCAPQAADIVIMTPAEIRFVNTDLAGRGFRLNANNLLLRRGSNAADPEDVLAANVGALTFTYLKKDGAPAATPPEVWMINVDFTLSSGQDSFNFRASVHPRSFR